MIDLHTHTTASDGQYPPEELVRRAWAAGVRILAVTDHDTLAGIERARGEADRLGARLVPGIELSAFLSGREVHVLGHFVDPADARLGDFSSFLRGEREKRMARMVEKARGLGLAVTLEEVVALADANLGRPHLAQVLVARGFVADVAEAFDRFLGVGRPAYVDRFRLTARDAICQVRDAGGTATLAHAHVSRVGDEEIAELARAGLAGLEVAHSEHSRAARDRLLAVARELDLVPTAGSDFHGEEITPDRRLGSTGEMDERALERLEARRPRR